MKRQILGGLIAIGLALWCTDAWANCRNLDDNPEWLRLFTEFNEHFKAGNYSEAIRATDELKEICADSPILNYAISRVYRKKGDHVTEIKYLTQATDNAANFKINEETLRNFWFARYEAEHPEVIDSHSQLEESNQLLQDLNTALAESQQRALASEHAGEKMQMELQYKEEGIYKILMWSGVAVSIAGIAMTGAGAYLYVDTKDNAVDTHGGMSVKSNWSAAWGLMGAGIAATVIGAAVTGYGGFHYVRKKEDNESMAFQISPTGAMFSYEF